MIFPTLDEKKITTIYVLYYKMYDEMQVNLMFLAKIMSNETCVFIFLFLPFLGSLHMKKKIIFSHLLCSFIMFPNSSCFEDKYEFVLCVKCRMNIAFFRAMCIFFTCVVF